MKAAGEARAAGALMRERPMSPHLSVYKMTRHTLLTSITNRFTGVALSVGLLVLVYWLMAIASGPVAYEKANAILGLGVFKLLLAGLLVAFVYHFVAGIRHLIWDTGAGMERAQAKRSAYIVAGVTVVLVVLLGYLFVFGVRS
jgi:succinate dehydrogenase / fumarate reductase cytochrome b subunit